MKYKIGGLGLALMASIFMSKPVHADVVQIGSNTVTAIIPASQFGKITIALQNPTTNVVYLNTAPVSSTTFASLGFAIIGTSVPFVLDDYHGDLYGLAPTAQGPVPLQVIGGN